MDAKLKEFYTKNNQLKLNATNGEHSSIFELYKLLLIEAFNLMPLNSPGLEGIYPPMCSLISHIFIKEAENTLLPLAISGNIEAQLYLIDLYHNGFEISQSDKAKYWLSELSENSTFLDEQNHLAVRQRIY